MKNWTVLILFLSLAGCVTAPTVQNHDHASYFNDSLFIAPSEPFDPKTIFAMSDEMRAYLNRELGGLARGSDRRHALFEALYSRQQLKLEYDSTMTRNAAQAFADRTGNCLSLVILTASFAKELGLPVQYQNVFSNQSISRINDTIYVSGHVNLALNEHQPVGKLVNTRDQPVTIDFLPPKDTSGQHARVIREATIVAMYLNNRAAETLSDGKLDAAYFWARDAIQQDPTFLGAYNTLAVIYIRHGNLHEAERILEDIIALEPGDTSPIANLIAVLNTLGRTDEARAWSDKLHAIQQFPPFYFFDLGMAAMQAHDYPKARDMFAKEVDRAAYYHEFHAWLAAAYVELGDYVQARKQLAIAIENSTTPANHDLYVQRLAAITPDKATGRMPGAH